MLLKSKPILLLFLIFGISLSCAKGTHHQPSKLMALNGELIMIGPVQFQDIVDQLPDWKEVYDEADISQDVINNLKKIQTALDIECFIGTWCSDSRYGVPPFIKALDLARNSNIKIELIAVDRQKDDPDHLGPKNNIQQVPTFIIRQGDKELFRMIEFPETTFAEDFINDLARK